MKSRLKKALLVFFIIVLVGAAAVYIFRRQIIDYVIPDITQIGAIQVDIKNDTCHVCPKLEVENATFIKIGFDTIHYHISIFNETYWHDRKKLDLTLPPNGKDTLDFCIRIPYADLIEDIAAERERGDSTNYSLSVNLQYSTFLGEHEINVSKSDQIKIPVPPEVDVVHIEYEKVRMHHISAHARIKIINHSAVLLSIKQLRYSMTIFKQADLSGEMNEPLNVMPHDTTYFDLPVEINVENLGKTLFAILLNNDRYTYELTLHGRMETSHPLRINFGIEATTEGEMELRK